jgi:translation initiation factor IF-2
MMEEIEAALKGMLKPVFQEVVLGQAEIRQLFKVSKVGTIAGCMVTSGVLQKSEPIRLIRDGIVIYEGKLSSLKRFQDDVAEVKLGYDCGILIENFNDLRERDIVECYKNEEVERQ